MGEGDACRSRRLGDSNRGPVGVEGPGPVRTRRPATPRQWKRPAGPRGRRGVVISPVVANVAPTFFQPRLPIGPIVANLYPSIACRPYRAQTKGKVLERAPVGRVVWMGSHEMGIDQEVCVPTVTVSSKFQVVIPKDVRDRLGIRPEQKVEVYSDFSCPFCRALLEASWGERHPGPETRRGLSLRSELPAVRVRPSRVGVISSEDKWVPESSRPWHS